MEFLLECLEDLDESFSECGGTLNMVLGKPVEVFTKLSKYFDVVRICFDQDCEAYWLERDNAVKNFCASHKIKVLENIGATLWDPLQVRQGPRFSIRMVIGIFFSDTETGAVTPPGVMQKK